MKNRTFSEEEIKTIEKIVDECLNISDLISFGDLYEKIKGKIKKELVPFIFPSPPFPVEDTKSEIINKLKKIKENLKEIKLEEVL